jgi:putative ABC transport system ATP-binding protein
VVRWSLSAAENIEFILQLQGVDAKTRHARSTELLQAVGLEGLGGRRPGQLSGGQQQRVAVARALASNPAIVLADEPTANLDSKNSDELLAMMSRLNQESNVTIIVATHDPKVIAHTRRHIVLTDGRIETDEAQAA